MELSHLHFVTKFISIDGLGSKLMCMSPTRVCVRMWVGNPHIFNNSI